MDGKILAQGLLRAKGDELRLVYALLVETKMHEMLVAKTKDLFNKDVDHFNENLQKEIKRLYAYSDEELQVRLFLYLLKQLKVSGAHFNIKTEIDYACLQIVEKAHALQIKQDKNYATFVQNQQELHAVLLVKYQMHKVFQSFDENLKSMSPEQEEKFIDQIEQFIDSLPEDKQRELKEKLQIDDLTDKTMKQLFISQGSVAVLAILVEVAGFAAFTTLTSVMATLFGLVGITLPFGAYIFATSALSVITGPVGIAAIMAGGGYLLKKQNDKMKLSFVPIGVVQLLLPAVLDEAETVDYEPFIKQWTTYYSLQHNMKNEINELETKKDKKRKLRLESQKLKMELENRLQDVQLQFDTTFQIIKSESTTVALEERSNTYHDLRNEMIHLNDLIEKQHQAIKENSHQKGLWDTIKGSVSNMSLKSELKKLEIALSKKEDELAWEVLAIQPQKLKVLCNQMNSLSNNITDLQQAIEREQNRYIALNSEVVHCNEKIEKLEKEVKQHQKLFYGLKDIE